MKSSSPSPSPESNWAKSLRERAERRQLRQARQEALTIRRADKLQQVARNKAARAAQIERAARARLIRGLESGIPKVKPAPIQQLEMARELHNLAKKRVFSLELDYLKARAVMSPEDPESQRDASNVLAELKEAKRKAHTTYCSMKYRERLIAQLEEKV